MTPLPATRMEHNADARGLLNSLPLELHQPSVVGQATADFVVTNVVIVFSIPSLHEKGLMPLEIL